MKSRKNSKHQKRFCKNYSLPDEEVEVEAPKARSSPRRSSKRQGRSGGAYKSIHHSERSKIKEPKKYLKIII